MIISNIFIYKKNFFFKKNFNVCISILFDYCLQKFIVENLLKLRKKAFLAIPIRLNLKKIAIFFSLSIYLSFIYLSSYMYRYFSLYIKMLKAVQTTRKILVPSRCRFLQQLLTYRTTLSTNIENQRIFKTTNVNFGYNFSPLSLFSQIALTDFSNIKRKNSNNDCLKEKIEKV